MNQRNYQREQDLLVRKNEASGLVPKLLLHVCCAPCSSFCLESLAPHFDVTVFFCNPNIDDPEEYHRRAEEEQRLLRAMDLPRPVGFLEGEYNPERFHEAVRGHETDPEGGERCGICFELRLRESAKAAKAGGFDYFTTSHTISPMKSKTVFSARRSSRKSTGFTARITAVAPTQSGMRSGERLSGARRQRRTRRACPQARAAVSAAPHDRGTLR